MHKIVDLGIHEIDVYDLEVEGCHNFFANGILVHNSVYYQIQPYVDRYLKTHDLDLKGKIDFCVRFADKVTQPIIDKAIRDFTGDLNAYDPSFCGCKREIVADALVHCDKKRYYGRIRVDEATEFPLDDPHIKITGLEIVRSTTPKFTVTKINEAIDLLFDADEETLKAWIAEMRKEFETAKIEVQKPFAQEDELRQKTARLNELNALLDVDKRDSELIETEGIEVDISEPERIHTSRDAR